MIRTTLLTALILLIASASSAGPKGFIDLFTPPLLSNTPSKALVVCSAVNVGRRQVTLELDLITLSGNTLTFGTCSPQPGLGCNISALVGNGTGVYCQIRVLAKGWSAARGVRGALHWLDADGVPSGTVVATR